jgi:hypothetical protein
MRSRSTRTPWFEASSSIERRLISHLSSGAIRFSSLTSVLGPADLWRSSYMVTEQTPNPACALKAYIVLMRQWVEAVMKGESVEDLIPVNVEPDVTWAAEPKVG